MTLLEIMVVLVIMGLMMAVVAVNVLKSLDEGRVQTTRLSMSSVQSALTLYYMKKGSYPTVSTGLKVLVELRFLDKMPRDGWGREFIYTFEGDRPVITSYGRDGVPGGDGADADISSLEGVAASPEP